MSKTGKPNRKQKSETRNPGTLSLTEQEASQLQANRKRRVFLGPAPGFTYNPLLKFPRNSPCPCRSGKKFKQCCLTRIPQIVKVEDAKSFKEQMSRPNLTFVTEENKETLKVAANMRSYFEEQERKAVESDETES
jgi:hypothetical protein